MYEDDELVLDVLVLLGTNWRWERASRLADLRGGGGFGAEDSSFVVHGFPDTAGFANFAAAAAAPTDE